MNTSSQSFFSSCMRIIIWLLICLLLLVYLVNQFKIRSDISFFLPDNHTTVDEVMKHQLKQGEAGKLILIALNYKDVSDNTTDTIARLAEVNKTLAYQLKQSQQFSMVQNGQQETTFLLPKPYYYYRYLLNTDPQSFSSERLAADFEQLTQRLDLMLTPLEQKLFSEDPQMIWLNLLKQWQTQNLQKHHGVWFDKNRQQTLLFVKSLADGYDLTQQKKNIDLIHSIIQNDKAFSNVNVLLTGSPVFALESRKAISEQIQTISVLASLTLMAFLFWFFRSVKIVLLTSLPLAFAVLTGLSTVIFFDGFIHGITIAFGITIIGIAVDYPVHYYSHRLFQSSTESVRLPEQVMHSIWPMIRLGLVTTIIGFSAITLSDFSGLKQLGLFAISGLVAAALTTRFILPDIDSSDPLSSPLLKTTNNVPYRYIQTLLKQKMPAWFRTLSFLLPLMALVFLFLNHETLWQKDLAALSPIPQAQKQLDFDLRKAMGLPELRYALIFQGQNSENLLRQSEQIKPQLDALLHKGVISGYDMAANYLPSIEQQLKQQQSLPSEAELSERLAQLLKDSPLDGAAFSPFITEVGNSRQMTPLTMESIESMKDAQSNFISAKLKTLLYQQADSDTSVWTAIIPLQGVTTSLQNEAIIQQLPDSFSLLDLKTQTESMLSDYRNNAVLWFFSGSLLILALLYASCRQFSALLTLAWPFTGAVLLTMATLLLMGYSLSIFHLVTLLLVVGLGIDYSIFTFFSGISDTEKQRSAEITRVSVIICLISTLIMFGALSLSELPVLKAIGLTASLGAFYAFCLTFIVNKQP